MTPQGLHLAGQGRPPPGASSLRRVYPVVATQLVEVPDFNTSNHTRKWLDIHGLLDGRPTPASPRGSMRHYRRPSTTLSVCSFMSLQQDLFACVCLSPYFYFPSSIKSKELILMGSNKGCCPCVRDRQASYLV
ncbi:unnamed protein product [Pylaiella littoralis]